MADLKFEGGDGTAHVELTDRPLNTEESVQPKDPFILVLFLSKIKNQASDSKPKV